MDREYMEAISKLEADYFYNQHLTLGSVLKIYTYPVLLQLPKRKACFIYGRTNWHRSVDSETLDICWSDELLELVNQ